MLAEDSDSANPELSDEDEPQGRMFSTVNPSGSGCEGVTRKANPVADCPSSRGSALGIWFSGAIVRSLPLILQSLTHCCAALRALREEFRAVARRACGRSSPHWDTVRGA